MWWGLTQENKVARRELIQVAGCMISGFFIGDVHGMTRFIDAIMARSPNPSCAFARGNQLLSRSITTSFAIQYLSSLFISRKT